MTFDPDTCLATVRVTIATRSRYTPHTVLEDLAEAFAALDAHLTEGGPLPAAWRPILTDHIEWSIRRANDGQFLDQGWQAAEHAFAARDWYATRNPPVDMVVVKRLKHVHPWVEADEADNPPRADGGG